METSGVSQRESEYAAAIFRNANSGGLQTLCRYHVINHLFIFYIEERDRAFARLLTARTKSWRGMTW